MKVLVSPQRTQRVLNRLFQQERGGYGPRRPEAEVYLRVASKVMEPSTQRRERLSPAEATAIEAAATDQHQQVKEQFQIF